MTRSAPVRDITVAPMLADAVSLLDGFASRAPQYFAPSRLVSRPVSRLFVRAGIANLPRRMLLRRRGAQRGIQAAVRFRAFAPFTKGRPSSLARQGVAVRGGGRANEVEAGLGAHPFLAHPSQLSYMTNTYPVKTRPPLPTASQKIFQKKSLFWPKIPRFSPKNTQKHGLFDSGNCRFPAQDHRRPTLQRRHSRAVDP